MVAPVECQVQAHHAIHVLKDQRERFQQWISTAGLEEAECNRLTKSLDNTANRFAQWRWQTLRVVISGMLFMREAMCV
eukprot:2164720-Lingulodinium_polyedra.AAC.1